MNIIIANNAASLSNALSAFSRVVTVEAEYGADVVEGYVTLAHHGSRSGNPCPCLYTVADIVGRNGAIGISHLDMDSLGGIMAVTGQRRTVINGFWEAIAFVDTHGVHKLHELNLSEEVVEVMNACWAWMEDHRVFAPRDGSALDVTVQVQEAIQMIFDLCAELYAGENFGLLQKGREWAAAKDQLDKDSFVYMVDGVVLRQAESFCNHLYGCRSGVGLAVVAHNSKTESITISLADPIDGVSCCEIAQKLWGPEAGGHAGIAGTPRGQGFTLIEAHRAARELALTIAVATTAVE